jgi:2-methylisocitrate lyase-like PEP mutase family enzyme
MHSQSSLRPAGTSACLPVVSRRKSGPERFREMLARPGLITLPGCYDVLSAILLERVGFDAVFVSGYGVAASLIGRPDIGLTSLAETIMVARNVVASVDVPVVLDLDNGYGNEDNAVRAVREAEAAGVAAIQLEDQILPKRCGHSADKRVSELDAYLRKLDRVLNARRQGLCVIARSDALEIDEGIRRAQHFHAAGADVTIIDGLKSIEDARRVAEEVPGPKQINLIVGGKTPVLSNRDVEALGFKIALYSTPALYVATKSIMDAMKLLKRTADLSSIAPLCMQFGEFQTLIGEHYEGLHSKTSEASLDVSNQGEP